MSSNYWKIDHCGWWLLLVAAEGIKHGFTNVCQLINILLRIAKIVALTRHLIHSFDSIVPFHSFDFIASIVPVDYIASIVPVESIALIYSVI